jgi:hypothetical protein
MIDFTLEFDIYAFESCPPDAGCVDPFESFAISVFDQCKIPKFTRLRFKNHYHISFKYVFAKRRRYLYN